ncbi:hypothetical protein BN185_1040026 [Clostridioides difficile E28]|nr:hypothetical protein BN185_1040026 [Clostridioides difficile E28]
MQTPIAALGIKAAMLTQKTQKGAPDSGLQGTAALPAASKRT